MLQVVDKFSCRFLLRWRDGRGGGAAEAQLYPASTRGGRCTHQGSVGMAGIGEERYDMRRGGQVEVTHHLVSQVLEAAQREAGDPVLAQRHGGAERLRRMRHRRLRQAPRRAEGPAEDVAEVLAHVHGHQHRHPRAQAVPRHHHPPPPATLTDRVSEAAGGGGGVSGQFAIKAWEG